MSYYDIVSHIAMSAWVIVLVFGLIISRVLEDKE